MLEGFGFSGFRSFGDDLAKFSPLAKINLIIGKNNSGKSNVIRFLREQYTDRRDAASQGRAARRENAGELDDYRGPAPAAKRIAFPLPTGQALDKYLRELIPDGRHNNERVLAKRLLESESLPEADGAIWFSYARDVGNGRYTLEFEEQRWSNLLRHSEWRELWSALTSTTGGSRDVWIRAAVEKLAQVPKGSPPIEFIPAVREVGEKGTEDDGFSGRGIIDRLAKIQNPGFSERVQRKDFDSINQFLQAVLERSDVGLEIPYDRDTILVHMDDKTLPLANLGTGIHEVIILAAAATILQGSILCVEEPELHLHPLLQRKLLWYLHEHTDNQYFFTTHSAHLLDAVPCEVFHIINDGAASCVSASRSTRHRAGVVADLGYRASDLLQANCIIWVEGPSDRIYLKYWIETLAPQLVCDVHYSVMFYGGRLSAHISGVDPEEREHFVEDLISLRQVNRNAALLMDSDRSGPDAPINETKRRLATEFDAGPGFCWITMGREIENYLDAEKLETVVLEVHSSAESVEGKGQWDKRLRYVTAEGTERRSGDKVRIARKYVEQVAADFTVLDLEQQVKKTCEFIREKNGLE